MEELNKEHNPGNITENSNANFTIENNHVAQDSEPAFSDEEEESPLRLFLLLYRYEICSILISSFFTKCVTRVLEL